MTDQSLMTDRIALKENERIDDLERNNLKIIQDTKRFCFGMDAVLCFRAEPGICIEIRF